MNWFDNVMTCHDMSGINSGAEEYAGCTPIGFFLPPEHISSMVQYLNVMDIHERPSMAMESFHVICPNMLEVRARTNPDLPG